MSLSDDQTRSAGWRLLRRCAGWVWILAWGVVLWVVASPWRDLGGLVDERLRWLQRFSLGAGVVIGWHVGCLGRWMARPGNGRSHASLLRWLLWPVAALAAAGLPVLRLTGNSDAIGVGLVALLSYWAGLDLAFGAWPLARGRPYSFSGSIDPPLQANPEAEDEDELAEPPPWMGL